MSDGIATEDTTVAGRPAPGDAEWKSTACILCECNCGIEVQLGGLDGRRLVRVRGDDAHPASKGYACEKPLRLDFYQNGPHRLTKPLRRRSDGTFEEIDWETAIREVREETGLEVSIVRPFDRIEYTFVMNGTRINKTVHYFLMEPTGGDLALHDHEFADVRWVTFADAASMLTFDTERALVARAALRASFSAFAAATSAMVRRIRLCGVAGSFRAGTSKRGNFAISAASIAILRLPYLVPVPLLASWPTM